MPITATNPFKWRHYPGDIILWCVRWYLRFPISFAHMAEMALERGLFIHSSCIWRWVQIYGPELDRRCRAHLKRTNKSYRVDETYIRIKGQDRYLYRAVDSTGQTIDFLLAAKRDAAAAKRFFRKTLLDPANPLWSAKTTPVVRQKCVRRHSVTRPYVRNGAAGRRGAGSGRSFRHSRSGEHADKRRDSARDSGAR